MLYGVVLLKALSCILHLRLFFLCGLIYTVAHLLQYPLNADPHTLEKKNFSLKKLQEMKKKTS